MPPCSVTRPRMRAAPSLVLILLLAAGFVPSEATAQTKRTGLVQGHQVWDSDHDVIDSLIIIANNSSLTIRGSTLTVHDANIVVANSASLRLESLPGSPAKIVNSGVIGFNVTAGGNVALMGLPEAPVVIDGLAGASIYSGQK